MKHQAQEADQIGKKNQANRILNNKKTTTNYIVTPPNRYECNDGTEERVVQTKILDILYDNEVCNLVYMRDITDLVN